MKTTDVILLFLSALVTLYWYRVWMVGDFMLRINKEIGRYRNIEIDNFNYVGPSPHFWMWPYLSYWKILVSFKRLHLQNFLPPSVYKRWVDYVEEMSLYEQNHEISR